MTLVSYFCLYIVIFLGLTVEPWVSGALSNPNDERVNDVPVVITNRMYKPKHKKNVDTCNIRAVLGFDFTDPDDAPYYGHHLDWIEVGKLGKTPNYICSAYYHNIKDNPDWCTYKNSVEGHDGAHVDNYMDEYYGEDELKNELATRETVRIKGAHDHVTEIKVYHWLFDVDYYQGYPEWKDHMMAAKLKLYNLSYARDHKNYVIKDEDKNKSWQHPVSLYIPTHTKQDDGTWVGNPDYRGNFQIEVHCNSKCRCEAKNYKIRKGFDAGRVAEGGPTPSETDAYKATYTRVKPRA